MSKNPTLQDHATTMQIGELFKKLKRFTFHLDPSLGFLGFFIIAVCGFYYLLYSDHHHHTDYNRLPGQSERFLRFKLDGSGRHHHKKLSFLKAKPNQCDVFDGNWVWDENYPLYQSKDCRFMDQGFRCSENGRPDLFYTKWRWQPKHCDLPRFDARLMLEKLRNKRLVFVGDSIGRNQWESLMCMLSSVISDKDSIYEVNGNPITKHKGFLVYMFKDYNCTVEYYRAPFLILQSRPPARASKRIKTTLKLDKMDWNSRKWNDSDVLVFNSGHWWNYEKTIKGSCYFQEGEEVKMKMSVEDAYKKSIETLARWIREEVDTSKTQVFFRTFAPVHFRGGGWRAGGSCHLETLPELGKSHIPWETWVQPRTLRSVLSNVFNKSEAVKMSILNVTGMTWRRKDGHSSLYFLSPDTKPEPLHRQDCSHWCLPGVPDSWNELLYAMFLKRESTQVY